jgi:hypothetical protein
MGGKLVEYWNMPGKERLMIGWMVPPPREPAKSKVELERERRLKVEWLIQHGYLRTIAAAEKLYQLAVTCVRHW